MPEKTPLQHLDDESLARFTLADEQMRSLYHSLPVSLISSIVIALILSVSHWKVIGQAEIIVWNLILGGTLLARLTLWIFWHNLHQLYSIFFWITCFRLGVWLSGAAWGAAAVLLFAHDDTIYQALLAFSLAGVASGSMTALTVDKYSSLGFVMLTISPLSVMIFLEDGPTAIAMTGMSLLFIFFVIASSARTRHNMEDQLNKNLHLLQLTDKLNHKQKLEKIINQAQSIYIGDGNVKNALSTLLHETLPLCQSELGFIGQIKKDAKENPYMCGLLFASHKKDEQGLEKFRAANLPNSGEYHNLDNLFGMIMRSDKPIISPNLARDMRAATLPEGHPAISSFIGIPIFSGREQIAILGLANSPQGYTNQTADELEPIIKSIAQFVQTMNHEQQHAQDKAALEASSQHTQTILNDIADGIITISKDGIIQSFNHAAETIFGYRAKQIIGKNVSELMPEPYKSQHDEHIKANLKTGKKNILGIGREVSGLRRNGDEFPMDLMVSRVLQNGEPIFIGIVRDITEKKRVEVLRSQFIAAATKEIMGPLNVISEAIHLLQKNGSEVSSEAIQNAINIADYNTIKLKKMMNELIEVKNLSTGETKLNLQAHMILPLIEEALHHNKIFSDIYQCNLCIKSTKNNLSVQIDSSRFHQVMSQLLQYMLKFSKPKSEIHLRINDEKDRVIICLNLTGKFSNDAIRKNLSAYFSHTNEPITLGSHAEGSIEISLAKEIIEKMHGKLYLENRTIEEKYDECILILDLPQATTHLAQSI